MLGWLGPGEAGWVATGDGGPATIDDAFTALRDYCRAARLPLTRTARELVTGQHDPDDVLAFRWPASPES